MVTNGQVKYVQLTVLRNEMLTTKIGERSAIVIKPEVPLDGALKIQGENLVWISNDPERILLKVDAKIKVGSIIAYLREHAYGDKKSGDQ